MFVYPPFGGMSTDARIRLLLADDTPKEIDSIFYRFLIQFFASRERGVSTCSLPNPRQGVSQDILAGQPLWPLNDTFHSSLRAAALARVMKNNGLANGKEPG